MWTRLPIPQLRNRNIGKFMRVRLDLKSRRFYIMILCSYIWCIECINDMGWRSWNGCCDCVIWDGVCYCRDNSSTFWACADADGVCGRNRLGDSARGLKEMVVGGMDGGLRNSEGPHLPIRSPSRTERSPGGGRAGEGGVGVKLVLIIGKASRVAAVFLTFSYLTSVSHPYVCFWICFVLLNMCFVSSCSFSALRCF